MSYAGANLAGIISMYFIHNVHINRLIRNRDYALLYRMFLIKSTFFELQILRSISGSKY